MRNRDAVFFAHAKKLLTTLENRFHTVIGARCAVVCGGFRRLLGFELLLVDDEAATDREHRALVELVAVLIEHRKGHAVRMLGKKGEGVQHDRGRAEAYRDAPAEHESTVGIDVFRSRPGFGGIDRGGVVALETEDDRVECSVAHAGRRKRAVQMHLDIGDVGANRGVGKGLVGEFFRGAHGADGVRTRGADPDLEQVKQADAHRGTPYRVERGSYDVW